MEWNRLPGFADKVADLCQQKYASLPKKGKPQLGKEWTLLAGVVKCCQTEGKLEMEMVAMGTGSKCLGKSKMSKQGDVLNDSHAEVLARRAFIRYLYGEVSMVYQGSSSNVLQMKDDNLCQIRDGVSFHFYTSHTPCGDASIFPKFESLPPPALSQGSLKNPQNIDLNFAEKIDHTYIDCDLNNTSEMIMSTSTSTQCEQKVGLCALENKNDTLGSKTKYAEKTSTCNNENIKKEYSSNNSKCQLKRPYLCSITETQDHSCEIIKKLKRDSTAESNTNVKLLCSFQDKVTTPELSLIDIVTSEINKRPFSQTETACLEDKNYTDIYNKSTSVSDNNLKEPDVILKEQELPASSNFNKNSSQCTVDRIMSVPKTSVETSNVETNSHLSSSANLSSSPNPSVKSSSSSVETSSTASLNVTVSSIPSSFIKIESTLSSSSPITTTMTQSSSMSTLTNHKPVDVTLTNHKPADVTITMAMSTLTNHKPADATVTMAMSTLTNHKSPDATVTMAMSTLTNHKSADATVTMAMKSDIYRTGAKCVQGGIQDALGSGDDYHQVGAFRIKPGRGERTLSMCCSDKIARWNVVGCQGALLSHYLTGPVYFQTIVTCRCPYNKNAMRRAIVERSVNVDHTFTQPYMVNRPVFLHSSLQFGSSKEAIEEKYGEEKVVPCSAGIIWCLTPDGQGLHDVTVNGKKQGVTAKTRDKPQARNIVCSKALFDEFLRIKTETGVTSLPELLQQSSCKTYKDYKMAAKPYQEAWQQLLRSYQSWEVKPPGYLDFC